MTKKVKRSKDWKLIIQKLKNKIARLEGQIKELKESEEDPAYKTQYATDEMMESMRQTEIYYAPGPEALAKRKADRERRKAIAEGRKLKSV